MEYLHIATWAIIVGVGIYALTAKNRKLGKFQIIASTLMLTYQFGYYLGETNYWMAAWNFILMGIIGIICYKSFELTVYPKLGEYSRKDLIRAQEIYHENYNEEPDVFKPIFTKAGATYHMNYILGIIDSNSYKMRMHKPEPPAPRKITSEG